MKYCDALAITGSISKYTGYFVINNVDECLSEKDIKLYINSEKVDENRELKMKIKELDKEIKYLTDKLY